MQIKAIEVPGNQPVMSNGQKDSLELLKQNEIIDELVNEWSFDINKISEGVNFNNLIDNILFVLNVH